MTISRNSQVWPSGDFGGGRRAITPRVAWDTVTHPHWLFGTWAPSLSLSAGRCCLRPLRAANLACTARSRCSGTKSTATWRCWVSEASVRFRPTWFGNSEHPGLLRRFRLCALCCAGQVAPRRADQSARVMTVMHRRNLVRAGSPVLTGRAGAAAFTHSAPRPCTRPSPRAIRLRYAGPSRCATARLPRRPTRRAGF
jgi:hypothetical protein